MIRDKLVVVGVICYANEGGRVHTGGFLFFARKNRSLSTASVIICIYKETMIEVSTKHEFRPNPY